MNITFFAAGTPKGQPRPKAFSRGKHAGVYDPGTADPWKFEISLAARGHLPEQPLAIPLRVELLFLFDRPKGHYGTGKNSMVKKPNAPYWHISKPDVDNLAKAVFDLLGSMGFWEDDDQICQTEIIKRYSNKRIGEKPGCIITIRDAI